MIFSGFAENALETHFGHGKERENSYAVAHFD